MDQSTAGTYGQHQGRITLAQWLELPHAEQGDVRSDDERRASERRFAEWHCSVCGRQLSEHVLDQTGEHTVFSCPVGPEESDPPPAPPLGETGQTKF
ncbi:hypothetical protein FVA74_05800 [Salinibacterium sp. dk2585]|uniref:hypothetical protein n=1 Tax=unclassified Salinibacterium TaxID=2632331 RepID=UPI0011C254AF|nr:MULTISPECIES: hypothetical protein [unclassified Salinibacterium]QEE61142.1 hypothetical protein FVA74_05800 [Salinibacterium sp. dk2585]TXK53085.1 hypothetical protein FVP63_11920 [Salinibacterium sp. dk5596]